MAEIVTKSQGIEAKAQSPRTRSQFGNSFSAKVAGTYRFGEIAPHFVAENVNADDVAFMSRHSVRSYTLKAPLMQDIKIHKDYFLVPNEAILPFNWQKIYTQPVLGDDIPNLYVNTVFKWKSIYDFFVTVCNKLSSVEIDSKTRLTRVLKFAVAIERFFSAGSLFSTLGAHFHKLAFLRLHAEGRFFSVDQYVDALMKYLSDAIDASTPLSYKVRFGDVTYCLVTSIDPEKFFSDHILTVREFLSMIRDDNSWYFVSLGDEFDPDDSLVPQLGEFNFSVSPEKLEDFNYSRELAYQIVCSHFYTNDKVDYIYTAELFRQNVHSLCGSIINLDSDGFDEYFSYNGVRIPYDYLSGHYLHYVLAIAENSVDYAWEHSVDPVYDLFRLLFGFNRSLRFVDYFTTAKTRPLAVGDVSAPVVSGGVNAIDTTQSIQKARFLNFVNKVGRRFEEYVGALGGRNVKPDYHNPLYLAETTDNVVGVETENTADDQFTAPTSVSSVLRGNADKYAFSTSPDRPCILIGVTYFDIDRFYTQNVERQNYHHDRFDMFNEFMQFVGDQPIGLNELYAQSDKDEVFGYGIRHSEYKQRVNSAFGGFVNNSLPGWLFLSDYSIDGRGVAHIGPDYIRSRSTELDRFYVSLNGYSLGTYWHFIIKNDNIFQNLSRPMVGTPTIL